MILPMKRLQQLEDEEATVAYWYTVFMMGGEEVKLREAQTFTAKNVWATEEPDSTQVKMLSRVTRLFHQEGVVRKVRRGPGFWSVFDDGWDEWEEWFMENKEAYLPRDGATKFNGKPILIDRDNKMGAKDWKSMQRLLDRGEVFFVVCWEGKTKRPSKAQTWREAITDEIVNGEFEG